MAMDQGGERLDEAFEDEHEDTEGWYFDLPSGAWERQEQINRKLRDTLLNKEGAQKEKPEQKRDPMTGEMMKSKRRFGFGRKSEAQPEAKAPLFRQRSSDDEPVGELRKRDDGDPDDWTTEGAPVARQDAENAPLLRNRRSEPPPPLSDDERPRSRWEEMFGGSGNGDILQGMSAWAKRDVPNSDEPAPADDSLAKTADEPLEDDDVPDILKRNREHDAAWTEDTGEDVPVVAETEGPAAVDAPLLLDRHREANDEDEALSPNAAKTPDQPAAGDEDIIGSDDLSAMQRWARREPVQDAGPGMDTADETPAGDADEDAADWGLRGAAAAEEEQSDLADLAPARLQTRDLQDDDSRETQLAEQAPKSDSEGPAPARRGLFGMFGRRKHAEAPQPAELQDGEPFGADSDDEVDSLLAATAASDWIDPQAGAPRGAGLSRIQESPDEAEDVARPEATAIEPADSREMVADPGVGESSESSSWSPRPADWQQHESDSADETFNFLTTVERAGEGVDEAKAESSSFDEATESDDEPAIAGAELNSEDVTAVDEGRARQQSVASWMGHDDGGMDAMRAWATRPESQADAGDEHPRRLLPVNLDDGLAEPEDPDAAREAMRSWAATHEETDAEPTPRRVLGPGEQPSATDDPEWRDEAIARLMNPREAELPAPSAAWTGPAMHLPVHLDDSAPEDEEEREPVPASPKKRGIFARLFGRKAAQTPDETSDDLAALVDSERGTYPTDPNAESGWGAARPSAAAGSRTEDDETDRVSSWAPVDGTDLDDAVPDTGHRSDARQEDQATPRRTAWGLTDPSGDDFDDDDPGLTAAILDDEAAAIVEDGDLTDAPNDEGDADEDETPDWVSYLSIEEPGARDEWVAPALVDDAELLEELLGDDDDSLGDMLSGMANLARPSYEPVIGAPVSMEDDGVLSEPSESPWSGPALIDDAEALEGMHDEEPVPASESASDAVAWEPDLDLPDSPIGIEPSEADLNAPAITSTSSEDEDGWEWAPEGLTEAPAATDTAGHALADTPEPSETSVPAPANDRRAMEETGAWGTTATLLEDEDGPIDAEALTMFGWQQAEEGESLADLSDDELESALYFGGVMTEDDVSLARADDAPTPGMPVAAPLEGDEEILASFGWEADDATALLTEADDDGANDVAGLPVASVEEDADERSADADDESQDGQMAFDFRSALASDEPTNEGAEATPDILADPAAFAPPATDEADQDAGHMPVRAEGARPSILGRFAAQAAAEAAAEDEAREALVSGAVDGNDTEPDLWAAIADEADGAGGASKDDFNHPSVYGLAGQTGTRHSFYAAQQEPDDSPADRSFLAADESDDEEDLILRAFEAHAATEIEPDRPAPSPNEFDELLGAGSDEIVEDSDEPATVSFARLHRVIMPEQEPEQEEHDDRWMPAEADAMAAATAALHPGVGNDGPSAPYPDIDRPLRDNDAQKQKTRTLVRELVETGLLALLVFLAVRGSFQNFKVDGNSMHPTLHDGQFLIVNKLVYSEVDLERMSNFLPMVNAGDNPSRHVFHPPERGDIIVLRDPSNPQVDLIKRVVGLPGDKLEIFEGAVYIDDYLLEEPYIQQQWHDSRQAVLVPDGHYFVLGDNRDNSKDSRSSSIGFVPEDLIIGRAELSYWPFSQFGLAPNSNPTISEEHGRPAVTTQRIERE